MTNATSSPKFSQPELQAIVERAVSQTVVDFSAKKMTPEQIAITLVDLSDPEHPVQASYRGDLQIYPASVIKMFYMVAAHRWMEDGRLADTAELRRAMHD